MERVVDVLVVGMFLLASVFWVGLGVESLVWQGLSGSVLMLVLAGVVFWVLRREWFWELADRFVSVGEEEHIEVREFLSDWSTLLRAFLLTIIVWFLELVNFWFLANLITPVGFGVSSLGLLVSALVGGSLVTSVGVAQVLVLITVLNLYLSGADAGAIGVLLGLVGVWVMIPVGFLVSVFWEKDRF